MKAKIEPHYETNPITTIVSGVKRAFSHSQQLAIFLIVIPMVVGVVNFIIQIFIEVFSGVIDTDANDVSGSVLVIGGVLFVFALALQIFIQISYVSLQAFSVVKIMRSEDASFGAAVSEALGKFWKILGTVILISIYALPYVVAVLMLVIANIVLAEVETLILAVSIPLSILLGVFLIVLMVRVYLRFNFATYALFDGAKSISSALERSKMLTHKRLSEVFGVRSLASLVPFISGMTVAGGEAVLYEQLKDARERHADLPKQHILNYLALFIFGGLAVILALFVLFILVIARA